MPLRCPDAACLCLALEALGYLVVHARPGEVFSLLALPNAHTLGTAALGGRWIAAQGSGFEPHEARAIALDRGGVCAQKVPEAVEVARQVA